MPAIATPCECWPKGDHGSFYEHRGERLERMKDNQARMVERVAALKEFYEALTPEQKVTFDELYAGSRRGIHRKHGHRTGMDKGAAK